MRAGLLSDRSIIQLINEKFVATWVLIGELKERTEPENHFAQTLEKNWDFPLDIMFLTSAGEFASKLNSFRDIPAHTDVSNPRHPFLPGTPTKSAVFYAHAIQFLRPTTEE